MVQPTTVDPEPSRAYDPHTINTILGQLGAGTYTQQYKVLTCPYRKLIVAGGERAGKSYTSALYLITRIPYGRLFWLVGPDYEQATAEFDYAVELLDRLGAFTSKTDISRPRQGKCTARTKDGRLIETKSADEVMKIAGKAPDGIVMCEAAQHSYESFLKCQGRVSEKRGWLFCCGTFEGSENWYAEYFAEWVMPNADGGVAFSLASWDNTFVYPGGRNDPEILSLERAYRRVEGLFDERVAAVPIPPVGLVFREVRKSVHVSDSVRFNKELPVYLAVDPSDGAAPYAVGAYQFFPCKCKLPHTEDRIEQGWCIDEVYEHGKSAEEVIAICQSKPWWKNVRGGAIDVEALDEKKRWLAIGRVNLKAEKIAQLHGIRREKSFLHYERDSAGQIVTPPHIMFAPNCTNIMFEYTKYKRKDPTDPDFIPKDVPPSNQPNHHIKALWYLLVARYGYVKGKKKPKVANSWRRSPNAKFQGRPA